MFVIYTLSVHQNNTSIMGDYLGDSSDDSDFSIEPNLNRKGNVNTKSENKTDLLTKTINLTSFGYANGKPREENGDMVISVKNMFSVEKNIRNNHLGTSEELQRALLDMSAN